MVRLKKWFTPNCGVVDLVVGSWYVPGFAAALASMRCTLAELRPETEDKCLPSDVQEQTDCEAETTVGGCEATLNCFWKPANAGVAAAGGPTRNRAWGHPPGPARRVRPLLRAAARGHLGNHRRCVQNGQLAVRAGAAHIPNAHLLRREQRHGSS